MRSKYAKILPPGMEVNAHKSQKYTTKLNELLPLLFPSVSDFILYAFEMVAIWRTWTFPYSFKELMW